MKIIILIATLTISSFSMSGQIGSMDRNYVICVSKDETDFINCVYTALNKGFEAQGNMVTYGRDTLYPWMYQTLVRR